ncbi:RluA family pseudouridine synthase [Arthrobacter sp. Leaf69]|uniref:RluA family pseudouridine synthase n=1 Tax=Arthrobacter sp. Leaf69 TaxID=1736232 RepID=UPI0006FCB6A0|nr:RluA family pseudouridine synthase [Arthrobacter sp. Leaf69]KQN89004.1 pseudouridine synthase [Arthrobacter sp. Leaf69]
MQSPLPVRDGVNATRLRLPDEGPWDTAMDYMMHRWGHIDPQGIEDRFDAGEIVGEAGVPLDRTTPLRNHTFIWYYRTLPPELRIPVELNILHQDEHLLVVDKPHFLPTTPGGTYIQESALVRLRNQLDLPDLIPMHRLDRMTAGILLLSTNPQTRGKYQVLFEKRQVQKEYECVSAAVPAHGHPAVDFPVVVRNRMTKSRSYLLAEVIDGEPNAETRIERLRTFAGPVPGTPAPATPAAGIPGNDGTAGRRALYRLEPHSGKTHQLRVHMASLGLGIVNDAFYPELLDKAPDDYSKPLQLLARGIRFVDPITGKPVEYRSGLELSEAL